MRVVELVAFLRRFCEPLMRIGSPIVFMRRPVWWLFLGGILVSLLIVRAAYRDFGLWRWAGGWLLALCNALAYDQIRRKAVGREAGPFFLWGLGGNGLRMLLFLGIVAGVKWKGGEPFGPFAISAVTGYLAAMVWEVWELQTTMKRQDATGPRAGNSRANPAGRGDGVEIESGREIEEQSAASA